MPGFGRDLSLNLMKAGVTNSRRTRVPFIVAGLLEASHEVVAVVFPRAGEPDRALVSPSANASAVDPSSSP